MQLETLNEIFGDFSVLKFKDTIDEAAIFEAASSIVNRLNLNYKDLYSDNLFFLLYENNTENCPGCDSCNGPDMPVHCAMCEEYLCPSLKAFTEIKEDKINISELHVPICKECYEKHKILPIGTVVKFISDNLRSYIENLIKNANGKQIELFLVC